MNVEDLNRDDMLAHIRLLERKVSALEEVAGDIFDEMVDQIDPRSDVTVQCEIGSSFVAPLAVALYSVEPKTEK